MNDNEAIMLCCKACGNMVFVATQEHLQRDSDGREEMNDLLSEGCELRTVSNDTVRKSKFCRCKR